MAVLGLELSPDHWGRFGVAIEIAAALLEYGFSVLNLDTIIGATASGNSRVARIAHWFGADNCGLSRRPRMDESARLEGGRLGDIPQRLEDAAWETALSQNELTAHLSPTPTPPRRGWRVPFNGEIQPST